MYMVRHAALRQFKFVDPFVLDFDAHAKPFDQLLLHKNHLFYSQVSIIYYLIIKIKLISQSIRFWREGIYILMFSVGVWFHIEYF